MAKSVRITVLVLLALSIVFLNSCKKEEPPVAEVEAVSAATDYTQIVSFAVAVEQRALRDKVFGAGTVQGQQEVVVKARTSGEIKSISASLGARLQAGDELVLLDDTVATFSLSQLEKQFENAQKELVVNEQLYNRGAISLSALNQSRSALSGLSAQLENARTSLANTRIITPIQGSIAELSKLVVGDLVQAGTQIARIVDLEKLRITLSVGQSQLFLIRNGAKALVTVKTPTEVIEIEGKVAAISASSDSRTGSWVVQVDFENPRQDVLKAGITAEVTIFNDQAPVLTLVPNQAMVFRNNKTYVFVAEGATAKMVEVVIVDQYGDKTAVDPVDDYDFTGKKVLLSALSRLYDGSRINITE